MSIGMKKLRVFLFSIMLVLIMTATMVVSASAASWSNVTISQGSYHKFSTSDKAYFSISAGTGVTQSLTFTTTVSSSVKAGYFKSYVLSPSYKAKISGSGSKTMSGVYTISDAGKYKFFIYNGSSGSKTLSKMTVTF